jgi:hypothetical protein
MRADPDFIEWAAQMNRAYEASRVRYRQLYPVITKAELKQRETEFAERKERWQEKLRGMRD